jgi:hypothetical protein
MKPDPFHDYACLLHFAMNFREGQNPYQQAASRIYEAQEFLRALKDNSEPTRPVDNKPESDHTRAVQIRLDRLNGGGVMRPIIDDFLGVLRVLVIVIPMALVLFVVMSWDD